MCFQAKGTNIIFNKTTTEHFIDLEKKMTTQTRDVYTTRNKRARKGSPHQEKNTKCFSRKATSYKLQVTYKGNTIRIIADCSTETLKARRS